MLMHLLEAGGKKAQKPSGHFRQMQGKLRLQGQSPTKSQRKEAAALSPKRLNG